MDGCDRWETPEVTWRAAFVVVPMIALLATPGCGSPGATRSSGTSTTHLSTATTSSSAPQPTVSSTTTTTTAPLPQLTIAGWTGREPVRIYFSGDAGNVATGLAWSNWGPTDAVGHGTRDELGCVPNCAEGSSSPYPATLTLSHPVNGVFTTILEQMADPKGTSETFTTPELAQGVCPTDDPSSCVFAGG